MLRQLRNELDKLRLQYAELCDEAGDTLKNVEALLCSTESFQKDVNYELIRIKHAYTSLSKSRQLSMEDYYECSLANSFSAILSDINILKHKGLSLYHKILQILNKPDNIHATIKLIKPRKRLKILQDKYGLLHNIIPHHEGYITSFSKPGLNGTFIVNLDKNMENDNLIFESNIHIEFSINNDHNTLTFCMHDLHTFLSKNKNAAFTNKENCITWVDMESHKVIKRIRPSHRFFPLSCVSMPAGQCAVADLASESVMTFNSQGDNTGRTPCPEKLIFKLRHAEDKIYALSLASNNSYNHQTKELFDSIYIIKPGKTPELFHQTSCIGGERFKTLEIEAARQGVIVINDRLVTLLDWSGLELFSISTSAVEWGMGGIEMTLSRIYQNNLDDKICALSYCNGTFQPVIFEFVQSCTDGGIKE